MLYLYPREVGGAQQAPAGAARHLREAGGKTTANNISKYIQSTKLEISNQTSIFERQAGANTRPATTPSAHATGSRITHERVAAYLCARDHEPVFCMKHLASRELLDVFWKHK